MTRAQLLVVLATACVACRKPEGSTTAAASASVVAVKESPPPAPPKPTSATRAFASFVKDTLDECVEVTLVAPPGTDQARVDKAADGVFKPTKAGGGSGELVSIPAPCAEQFADRTALASCSMSKTEAADGGVVTMLIGASYFNLKTLNDDTYMKDCLKGGGKWTAAKKDDPNAARERLRQRAKQLQDLSDKMNAPQE